MDEINNLAQLISEKDVIINYLAEKIRELEERILERKTL
jgi:hypothetical protein